MKVPKFKTIKEGKYDHLNRHGRKRTKDSDIHEKISSKNRAMVIPLLSLLHHFIAAIEHSNTILGLCDKVTNCSG